MKGKNFRNRQDALNGIYTKLRNLEKANMCNCNSSSSGTNDPEILQKLCDILAAIENNTAENENNLHCTQVKACDADCKTVVCHTCYDVVGAIISINHRNPDGTLYTGDVTTIDLDCSKCRETICAPAQGPSLASFNSYNIGKPKCCVVKITTSAGEVILPEGMMSYSNTFDCLVTDFAVEIVSGNCKVTDLWIDLIKSK